ncbi:hypothetical protein M3181_06780 [Mesobacillus maritimus]|uniref:hypothetical protein n=1 Tax=Mesobacillus maritimus TaxID=1643336 RepID=UPI00203A788A|nr:hypothetical protein [Mesobacillus maritimus]MCM3668703.1 hypothetical protein [Mesobacillus maritimus]
MKKIAENALLIYVIVIGIMILKNFFSLPDAINSIISFLSLVTVVTVYWIQRKTLRR